MAAEPYSVSATLTLPPDAGQPNETLSCNFAGTFNNATQQKLNLGSGTHVINLGTIPAFATRLVWIEYERPATGSPPPIDLSFNDGVPMRLAAGGFFILSSPLNVASLALISAAPCTVRVALLG